MELRRRATFRDGEHGSSAAREPHLACGDDAPRHLAYGEGPARRFYNDVLPLAALENHSAEAVAALTALVSPGEQVMIFEEPPAWMAAMARTDASPATRWSASGAASERGDENTASVMLDPLADAAEMVALKAIAFPGLFGIRTPELGGTAAFA